MLSAQTKMSKKNKPRRGLTLLEVIVAMTIFLISLGAIIPLIQMGQMRALEIEMQTLALQKCQSKLAEIIAGVEALASQSDVPFEDNIINEDWRWSMDANQEGSVSNLWNVQVKVYREMPTGRIEVALNQMILDPAIRGGPVIPTVDPNATDPATTDPATGGGTGTGGTGGGTGGGGGG